LTHGGGNRIRKTNQKCLPGRPVSPGKCALRGRTLSEAKNKTNGRRKGRQISAKRMSDS